MVVLHYPWPGVVLVLHYPWPRVVVVLHYPWQIDLLIHGFVSLSHATCGSTLNHFYLSHFLSWSTCFWELDVPTPKECSHENAHPNPSNQSRPVYYQLMFPYASPVNLRMQFYWLTQQLKTHRFNRSICQVVLM